MTFVLAGLLLQWAAPAFADRLFAANGGGGNSSTLFILDPETGAVISEVGPIGFAVSGLAYDPRTGILYGSTGNNSGLSLIRIDIATGAGTLIGPFNTDTPMADLSFDPAGNLFGWSGFNGTRGLYEIDVTTGEATFVGPNTGRGSFLDGNGLAFDAAGNLFGGATDDVADSAALFSVDPETAVSTFIANLLPLPGNPDASVSALAFDSAGTLFGTLQNFSGSPNSFDSFLVTIDPDTGAVQNRGQSIDRLDAIVFVPDLQPAPSLSTLGLAVLSVLLLSAGMWQLSRRFRNARSVVVPTER
jgi:DNA-binding beta-propeller fold protein YncE